ncbi:MAG: hemerythrin domain-containing protein [Acidobacteriota bacterium]
MSSSFLRALLDEHASLDALFLEHQALLVEGRPAAARRILLDFQASLGGHMRGEEEVILPFYEAHCPVPKGGAARFFHREHDRLRRLVDESAAWLSAWEGLAWPSREVVFLVERQKVFKEVMEHQDERERHFLYPLVEACSNDTSRAELMGRFRTAAAGSRSRLARIHR